MGSLFLFPYMNIDKEVLQEFHKIISENKIELFQNIAAKRTKHLTVVMENIHHDHNASAVLRTCDCFGIQEMYTIEKNHSYKIQRDIARGAGNWVDLISYNQKEDPEEQCIQDLKAKGYKIIAACPHENDYDLNDLPIDEKTAIVLGTEWDGVSEKMKEMADGFVKIPMFGFTESFNVSVSAALILQDLRTRLNKSKLNFLLTEEEQIKLQISWCTKIIRNGEGLEKEIRKRLLDKNA